MYRTGLVVGKFYPPHRGHKHLIDSAWEQTEHLTVLVCDHPDQTLPGELRGAWLREIHPDVDVRVIPDDLPDDDSKAWADNCRKILGYAPEAVFTSEDYGDAFAHHLGAVHVSVDRERRTVPCSGTAIRNAPLDHLDFLEPCVRAYYVKRVCVIGAESTGTTTMAQSLAEHYRTLWVPEYGREYSERKMLGANPIEWSTEEFVHIATEQNRQEDAAARKASRVLICDTDSFATCLWHERYMGTMADEVNAIARGRTYDLYLLTDVDIPFVQDGTRDGEHIREAMHTRFQEELRQWDKPFLRLSGSHKARMEDAVAAIDALLLRQSREEEAAAGL